MIITKLKYHSKNKNLIHISGDDKYLFTVDISFVAKYGLTKGMSIGEKDLKELYLKALQNRFYYRSIEYISRRPRSKKEVREYCDKQYTKYLARQEKQGEEEDFFINKSEKEVIIDLVLERLKSEGVVNETAFANWWYESRFHSSKKSVREINNELYRKGVNSQIIQEVATKYQDNDYVVIKKLIEKRLDSSKYKGLSRHERNQKLIQYLVRKGFQYNDVRQVIAELSG